MTDKQERRLEDLREMELMILDALVEEYNSPDYDSDFAHVLEVDLTFIRGEIAELESNL